MEYDLTIGKGYPHGSCDILSMLSLLRTQTVCRLLGNQSILSSLKDQCLCLPENLMHLDIKKEYLHIGIAQALPVAALGTAISHFYGGQA